MKAHKRAAAIIAGGRAKRLGGVDKSRLVVGGRTIISRQAEVLRQIADEVFVVGEYPGRPADLGLPGHDDLVAGVGAIGGLYTALEIASADLVLVVACDLPFLEASMLEHLCELAATADAAWVRTAAGVEPLVACYRRGVRGKVRAAIDEGRLKLADLSATLEIRELAGTELARFGDPARLLTNVNTPDEYERIQ